MVLLLITSKTLKTIIQKKPNILSAVNEIDLKIIVFKNF